MSTTTIDSPLAEPKDAPPINLLTLAIGGGLASIMVTYLSQSYGWRQGALFVVGVGAGLVLYHAAFGFTSAWRNALRTAAAPGCGHRC